MPVSIVVGGQYGSEGKGKVAALLGRHLSNPWHVRCGGPNSGHTVTISGQDVILRQVPCSADPSNARFCIAAGCVIDEAILLMELDLLDIPPERIVVDPRAVLLEESDREEEGVRLKRIASTCSGTGFAQVRRILRGDDVRLAVHSESIRSRCTVDIVAQVLNRAIDSTEDVIIEGTQGFALSLLHGKDYPFVTSRDTTAAGFAMEVGISPRLVDHIILVLRTYPIRVGGTSGPFLNELTWDDVTRKSGAPSPFPEFTSVTNRLRRVAEFDMDSVKLACQYNRPTSLAVMGLDRIDYQNTNVKEWDALTESARHFVAHLESNTGVQVAIVGTGFGTFDAISLTQSLPIAVPAYA